MKIFSENSIGSIVSLKTSNPLHFSDKKEEKPGDDISTSFANVLKKAIGQVNDLQVDSQRITQQMLYKPESVDIHSVMNAAQKAEIALTFTKSIRDEAIRAYRELINLR